MKGYGDKFLRVDLSSGDVKVEDVPPEFPAKYLGGIGFASRILYDEVEHVDPLKPENKLVIVPGLLVGTGIPTASKTVFVARSPLTRGFGRAVAGASLGVDMRKAGYESIVIEGASEEAVVLNIDDGEVAIEDGSDLWGMDVRKAAGRLRDRYGKVSTAVIGPAGERLSLIADIDCDERQAGRTGLGAVLGSKRLKGICVRGTGRVEYADPEELRVLLVKWNKILREHPASELDMKYGTAEFYDWVNRAVGVFPSRNWQHGYFQAAFDNLGEEERSRLDPYYWAPIYTVKSRPCPNCTKPCGRIFRVEKGKFEGTELDGLEYEIIFSLGGMLEIDDPEAVAKLHLSCDLYGLDGISAGVTISWAMEAVEKGLLSPEDLDGIELGFGDVDAALEILKRMAYKEGKTGGLLADGVRAASRRLGKGSEAFALHVKGLELPAYDVRGIKGMGLAYAVSSRGGCHLTAGVYGTELTGSWWSFSGVDRFSAEHKGYEVKVHEDLMTLYDAVGICKFSRHMFYAEGMAELIEPVIGVAIDVAELMTIGERIYNLQRAFMVREGFSRRDDALPPRILREPVPKGPSEGSYVKPKELEKMLDDYYTARGWSEDGVPTKTKLITLDLIDIAEEIGVGC